MKAGICYIVGAGENYGLDFKPEDEDFVIAVDAGYRFLEEKEIRVSLAVGDYDSLCYVPRHPNVIVLKPEKDDTDMLAALREGIRAGYECFCIYCGTGGRLDHTIANLQLLADLAAEGKRGFLFDRESVITAVTDGSLVFPGGTSGYVSVFSHTEQAVGVYLEGLKYKLEDATLTNTYPLGISNEFTGEESRITVRKGTLLVFFPRGMAFPEFCKSCGGKTGARHGLKGGEKMVETGAKKVLPGLEQDSGRDTDVEALIELLDNCTQAGESRIKVDVVEGNGEVLARQYHHGRCDIGSPWACGTAFDVLE